MKKLIFLLLISGGLSAQVVIPKSTTTFSNISATGNLTVNGTARVTGATTLTGAATLSSSTTIGTGTVAANTSSLGIVRIKQGSSWIDFGESNSRSTIWLSKAPSASNYDFSSDGTNNYINCQNNINFAYQASDRAYFRNTDIQFLKPVRIGALTVPSATLDVTGTMSVSGTSTLTGAVATNSIYGAVSSLVLGSVSNNNNITIRYGNMDFAGAGHSGNGSNPSFYFITPSHYSITASTNVPAFKITGATRGWLTGAISTQYENHFTAPTYTAAGASTITTAAGLYVAKPIMGTNMTATNIYGIATDGNLLLGSAGLTGGNTGTVAVLSDAMSSISFQGINASPADATTYYFGNGLMGTGTWVTNQGWSKVYLPYNATIVGWTANFFNSTSNGSAETATLSVNVDNTPTTLSSAITMKTAISTFTASGLNISVNSGSYIEAKLLTPTWVTNPVGTVFGITFWFVRRQ